MDEYVELVEELDRVVVHPAVTAMGGMSARETDRRQLVDYFSPRSIQLLAVR